MQLEQATFCPLVKGPCKKLECLWFIKLQGTNPQTGQAVDEYNCAVAWLPMLLIENAQMSKQTGAAVESFRNEMSTQNGVLGVALLEKLNG